MFLKNDFLRLHGVADERNSQDESKTSSTDSQSRYTRVVIAEGPLPGELFLHTFSYLRYGDLAKIARVSQWMNEIVSDSSLWQVRMIYF